MIKFNDIIMADTKDDFELAGKHGKEFSIYDFIGHDLSRAVVVGYCIKDWDLWIPVTVRKELRHSRDSLAKYTKQLEWLNTKLTKDEKSIECYANFIMDNIFCDNEIDKINIAINLGLYFKAQKMNE